MSYILHAAKNEEFIKTEDMLACIKNWAEEYTRKVEEICENYWKDEDMEYTKGKKCDFMQKLQSPVKGVPGKDNQENKVKTTINEVIQGTF